MTCKIMYMFLAVQSAVQRDGVYLQPIYVWTNVTITGNACFTSSRSTGTKYLEILFWLNLWQSLDIVLAP